MNEKKRPTIFISDCGNYIAIRVPMQPEWINFDVWRHDGSEYWEGTRDIQVPDGKKGCYNPRTYYTEEFTHPKKIVGSWTNLARENRNGEWVEAFELTLHDLETKESSTVQFHTPLLSLAPRYEKRRENYKWEVEL